MGHSFGKDFNKLWINKGNGLAGILPTDQLGIRPGAVGCWDSSGQFVVRAALDTTWGIELPPIQTLTNELSNFDFSSTVKDTHHYVADGKGKLTEVETLPTTGDVSAKIEYEYEDDNSFSVVCDDVSAQGWSDLSFLERAWNEVLYKNQNSWFSNDISLYFDAWNYRIVYEVFTATDYLMTGAPSNSSKFSLTGTAEELSALEGGHITGSVDVTSSNTDDVKETGFQGQETLVAMNLGAFETWSVKGQKNHRFMPGMNAIT
ncbi:MAG: hypothetical protein AAF217_06100 [Pseudomonadota bacterium]